MTEAEWLHGWFYRRMYDEIRERATTRQVRLYMVACCRLKAAEFFDPRIPRALEIAERCADDPRAEAVGNAVWDQLVTSPYPQLPQTGPDGEITDTITGAWHLLNECWNDAQYHDPREAIAHAAYMSLRDGPREVFTGGQGDAAEYCARAIDHADSLRTGWSRRILRTTSRGWKPRSAGPWPTASARSSATRSAPSRPIPPGGRQPS